MKVINTGIDGLFVVSPKVYEDSRGYFFESYSELKFKENNLNITFVQDNISKSKRGTVRGLHYQAGEKAQGKLCHVICGKVLDVAVDIRFGSPTFGKFHSEILSGVNHHQMWIPPGFAHGFSVLSDEAIFHYKCTEFYSKPHERAIRFNDPQLKIDWLVDDPVVSDKDMLAPFLNEIEKDFTY